LVSPEDLLKPAFLASLQLPGPLLDIQLGPEEHRITVYSPDGNSSTDLTALEPFLRSDTSHEALEAAASAILAKGTKPNASASSLPAEIEQMATEKGVNVGQVDKLMGRMSRRLFRKMSKESDGEADAMKDQARSIMMSQGNINWNSPVAQRLQLIMQHLSVPENWHLPDWKAIVGAYPLALQQQRGGDLLLPGDRETLQRVPDAAEFMPIYYARRITE
jgi:hypothetical protein